jgi:hypothetical protein
VFVTIASIPAILSAQSGSSAIAGYFNLPGAMLGAADFGVISSARPARTVQLGLRLGF